MGPGWTGAGTRTGSVDPGRWDPSYWASGRLWQGLGPCQGYN